MCMCCAHLYMDPCRRILWQFVLNQMLLLGTVRYSDCQCKSHIATKEILLLTILALNTNLYSRSL